MDLKEKLSNRLNINAIHGITSLAQGNQSGYIDSLCELLEEKEDKRVSDNAAWVLLHLRTNDKKEFLNTRKDHFIDLLMETESETKKRLLMDIVKELGFEESEVRANFLDYCLATITNCGTAVGIRALCIYLAYQQCRFFPELRQELKELLTLMDDNLLKPGLKSAKKRVLDQIKKKP